MTNLFYIREFDLLPVLTHCFNQDSELINRWHIESPSDPHTCAERTFTDLQKANNLKFFTLYGDKEIIGFFGIEQLEDLVFLTSFFISPKYRNKEVLGYFWLAVEEQAGREYFSSVYTKNTRAQKFLEKNGFKVFDNVETDKKESAIIYKNN